MNYQRPTRRRRRIEGRIARRHVALAVLLPAAIALAAFVWTARVEAQTLRMGIYVSVVDQNGAPVPDVKPNDIVIREDNVAREILSVDPVTDPMQVAVLVDNSQAARDVIPDIRRALPVLVDALLAPSGAAGPRNEVAIVTLADRPTLLVDYTRDRARLEKGINVVWSQPGSGSTLLDAIVEVSQGLKKRGAQRSVLIAITAEGPELSNRYYDQVLPPLRESGAAFHAFVLDQPSSSVEGATHDRAIVLDKGTGETGGHLDVIQMSSSLPMKLQQMADELTHQYRVTYARPTTLIPPEHITVSTPRAGLTARGTPIRDQQGRP